MNKLNSLVDATIVALEGREIGDAENKLFETLRSESEVVFCEKYEHLSDDTPLDEHKLLLRQIEGHLENCRFVEDVLTVAMREYLRHVRPVSGGKVAENG